MITITGVVESSSRLAGVVGLTVTAHGTFERAFGNKEGAGKVRFTAGGGGHVRRGGKFSFPIEADGQPVGPITVKVSAPDGAELSRRVLDRTDAYEGLRIIVKPENLPMIAATDPTTAARPLITGRVVDERGRETPPHLPVIIWGSTADGSKPQPLLFTETQPGGLFSVAWTAKALDTAKGQVADRPPTKVPLAANGVLPRQILLVVDLGELPETADCGCHDGPQRAPEPADLTQNPAAFSQDLGGSCVDLTMPNRAVEEFAYTFVVRTSEPRVRATRLSPHPQVPKDLLSDLLGASVASEALHPQARTLSSLLTLPLALNARSARHLVRADRPPTLSAVTRAAWLSEVSSLHTLIDAAVSTEGGGRSMLNATRPIDWDATPTIHESVELAYGHVLHYREVWRADGYSLGDLLYSLPLAPSQRRQIAVVDWERSSAATSEEDLEFEEQVDAALSHDRVVNEVVGTSMDEETAGGSRSTTWGVAGGLGGGYTDGSWGIFGGAAGGYARSDSSAWQQSAREFSADSVQKLRDRVIQRSSAVRDQRTSVVQEVSQGEAQRIGTETVANYNRCHAITVEYFEVLRHFLVTHELADVTECLFVPFPMEQFDRRKALRWREPLRRRLKDSGPVVRRASQGSKVVTETDLSLGFGALARVADDWVGSDYPESRFSEEALDSLEGELRLSFSLPRPRDADDEAFLLNSWGSYQAVLGLDVAGLFRAQLAELSARERDRVFQRDIAPRIAEAVVARLQFAFVGPGGEETSLTLDPSLVSRYAEGVPLYVSLSPAGALPPVRREDIAYFKVFYEGDDLPGDARVIARSARLRYRAPHSSGLLVDAPRLLDDLGEGDPVVISAPLSRQERRNPRAEDRSRADRLLIHLNANLEYYHRVIWSDLDPQRRYMLLDSIIVPGTGGRSVASMCTNRLIGIVGNSLVVPLAPGQKLDPTLSPPLTDTAGASPTLRDAYSVDAPSALRVSVPTRGVYAEAVSGECSACEETDDARHWRWATEGLLGPPGILAVDTGSRAVDDPAVVPTGLPSPVVTIQNAPAVPPPTGLQGAFELLAAKELFPDIAGLEGTQKNAMAAFEQSIASAGALGEQAFTLASQGELSRSVDRVIDRIVAAQADGLLTPDVAKELTTSALRGALGQDRQSTGSPAEDEAVKGALESAVSGDRAEISVSSPTESVSVSFNDSGPVKAGAEPVHAATGTDPNSRTCCALGQWRIGFAKGVDPGALGGHRYAGGVLGGGPVGYVYTDHAGFIDLGHLRDLADMTKFVFDGLAKGATHLELYEGDVVVLHKSVTIPEMISLAGRISYVESWAHELTSWGTFDDFSSFSPEDIPSNIAGIVVGMRALQAIGAAPSDLASFNAEVDVAVAVLMDQLGARSKSWTERALDRTADHWWKFHFDLTLLRRNFDGAFWMPGMSTDDPQSLPHLTPAAFDGPPGEFTYVIKKTVNGRADLTLPEMTGATEDLRSEWTALHPGMDSPS